MTIKAIQFCPYQKGRAEKEVLVEKFDEKIAQKPISLKELTFSDFNYTAMDTPHLWVGFNAMTATLLKLEGKYLSLFRKLLTGKTIDDHFLLHKLVQFGFLIPRLRDERAELRTNMMSSRFRTDNLSLTLLPTESCNFRCVYCYEARAGKFFKMNKKVQEEVLRLAQAFSKKMAGCRVQWFGGEPLLAFDLIEAMSEKLIAICDDKKAFYSAGVTTNGYLLSEEKARKLQQLRTNSIQVTIDGPKEIHDKKRPLLNGKGTYERIIENVGIAADYIHITIRVNVDKENIERMEKLLEDLEKKGLHKKISIYFSCLHESCNKEHDQKALLSLDEYFRSYEDLQKKASSHGFRQPNFRIFSKLNAANCTATVATSYVIGPRGEMYKCTGDIGDRSKEIGTIFELSKEAIMGIGNTRKELCYRYMNFDATTISVCKNCCFLPICMGGCAKIFIETNGHNKNCAIRKSYEHIFQNEALELLQIESGETDEK